MRILAVSDVESKHYYDYYTAGKLDGIDLILACGDMKTYYLEFLATMSRCPVLYVHGNHDECWREEPGGCDCVDDRLCVVKGLRILGLGGSYRYRDGKYMYTESEMKRRIFRLGWQIQCKKGFDILLTHAPMRGLNDMEDLPHQGFACFEHLLERYEPRLFIHGHVHRNYGTQIPQRCTYGKTTVINAYDHCMIDI